MKQTSVKMFYFPDFIQMFSEVFCGFFKKYSIYFTTAKECICLKFEFLNSNICEHLKWNYVSKSNYEINVESTS